MINLAAEPALRFYPAAIDAFPDEALPGDFAITSAGDLHGEGLVALRAFTPGALVFAFTGEIVPRITQYTLQLDADRHIHDPWVMGKVLHHCVPNCHVDLARRTFIAIRPIAPGDYVTMDYCQTEDVLYRAFQCNCGAPQCRGFIHGRSLAIPDVVAAFVAQARERLGSFVRSTSRYENLLQIADICQQLGNALGQRIYEDSAKAGGSALACSNGCGTCCHIPTTVPQLATTDYTMSLLDLMVLIEHRHQLQSSTGASPPVMRSDILPVVPCPQLTAQGNCSIYGFRPLTCKIWFSASLDLCIRNRERGYRPGVNLLTDVSDRLRSAFEQPFEDCVAELVPGLAFRGYEFLTAFNMALTLLEGERAEQFRTSIDAGLSLADSMNQQFR